MSWPSIAGISMIEIRGALTPLSTGSAVDEHARKGRSGHTGMRVGARAPVSVLVSIKDHTTKAVAKADVINCKSLEGTHVTVIDEHGQTWNNVRVLRVTHLKTQHMETPSGGTNNGDELVWLQWEMRCTE